MSFLGGWAGRARIVAGDALYALRGLRNAPAYAATLLLTLALGLGAVTAMLAVVDSVLLRPVKLDHSEQLVVLQGRHAQGDSFYLAPEQIELLGSGVQSFAGVAAYHSMPKPVDAGDGARTTMVTQTTPNLYALLGVTMLRGRQMTAQDTGSSIAVVNYAFWQDRLHGRPDVVGAAIRLNGRTRTVAGVLPRGLHFPQGTEFPAVFVPMVLKTSTDDSGWDNNGIVLARLKPHMTAQQALAETATVLKLAPPGAPGDKDSVGAQSYAAYLTGEDEHFTLLALLGGAGVLLLIACANAAILQIARATARTGEMQVRSALGAGFLRLLQQLLTESVCVSLLGATLGAGLAYTVVAWVRHSYGQQFSRFDELAVHPLVLVACAALAVLAGVLASLAPVWRLRQQTGIAASMGRVTGKSRVAGLLVAVQVALTCVLLATAGLFLRTLHALEQTELGFDPHHVTTMVLIPETADKTPEVGRQTVTALLQRFAALPGVDAAMMQTSLPFSSFNMTIDARTDVSGRRYRKDDSARYSMVSANFVQASGMRLIRGRDLRLADDTSPEMVALVNENFVQRFLGQRDPVGVFLRMHRDAGGKDDEPPFAGTVTIVGVVGNELQGGELGAAFQPMVYLDYRQLPASSPLMQLFSLWPQLAVRSSLPQATLNAELRAAVKQTAPQMAEMNLAPMEQAMADSLNRRRLMLRLVSGFGAVAMVLAAIGLYGVLASSVAQRRKEIGIRMALGSSRGGVTRLVAHQAGRMVLAGLALGVAGAWLAGRAVRAFLYGVTVLDPYALVGAAVVLCAVSALAAMVPAWRASRLEPIEVLREE